VFTSVFATQDHHVCDGEINNLMACDYILSLCSGVSQFILKLQISLSALFNCCNAHETNPGLYGGSHPRSAAARKKYRQKIRGFQVHDRRVVRALMKNGVVAPVKMGSPPVPHTGNISIPMSFAGIGKYGRVRTLPYSSAMRGFSGSGSYLGQTFGKIGGSVLGGALGSLLGQDSVAPGVSAGGKIGGKLGDFFGDLLGFGKYTVARNSYMGGEQGSPNGVPFMHSSRENFRIRDHECLGDLISSGTSGSWTSTTYVINPGLSTTFPWLSQIASNFEQYRVHGLVFYFRSTSASSNPSGGSVALGTVVMSTNYNATAAPFTTKVQAEASQWCVSGKPDSDLVAFIECDPKQTTGNDLFYVRTGAVPSGQDQKDYDMGFTQVSTVGVYGTSQTLGETWVCYDIEFLKPLSADIYGNELSTAHYNDITSADVSATYPLGESDLVKVFDDIGLMITPTTITFPVGVVGTFLLSCTWIGSATSSLAIPNVTSVNATAFHVFNDQSTSFVQAPTSGTDNSTTLTFLQTVKISSPSAAAVFTFSTGGVLPATVTGFDLLITQVSALLV